MEIIHKLQAVAGLKPGKNLSAAASFIRKCCDTDGDEVQKLMALMNHAKGMTDAERDVVIGLVNAFAANPA